MFFGRGGNFWDFQLCSITSQKSFSKVLSVFDAFQNLIRRAENIREFVGFFFIIFKNTVMHI